MNQTNKSQSAFVKIGTGPLECVEVRGEDRVGALIEFRRLDHGERWQQARITGRSGTMLLLALE